MCGRGKKVRRNRGRRGVTGAEDEAFELLSPTVFLSFPSSRQILITFPSLQALSSNLWACLSLSLIILFSPSPQSSSSVKIKDTFVTLQCLIMSQSAALSVWSNNNSLISFYLSLSNIKTHLDVLCFSPLSL